MKRFVAILAVCLALLALWGCGTKAGTESTPGTADQTVGGAQTAGTDGAEDKKVMARSCEGKSVDALFALIGQPDSSEYAPSCLNPGKGEDGVLYYDGFVVYTYKEGGTETVEYVE